MDSEHLSQLAKEIIREIENGAGLEDVYDSCYVFNEEIEPGERGRIGVDGFIDLFRLIRRLHWGVAHPATEIPEGGEGHNVILQFGSRPDMTIAHYSESAALEKPELGGWLTSHGSWLSNPQCWWDLPAVLPPEAVAALTAEPEPVPEPEELSSGEAEFPGECPKCRYTSGHNWGQCEGSCPVPGSPHYNATEALRRILRPVRRS